MGRAPSGRTAGCDLPETGSPGVVLRGDVAGDAAPDGSGHCVFGEVDVLDERVLCLAVRLLPAPDDVAPHLRLLEVVGVVGIANHDDGDERPVGDDQEALAFDAVLRRIEALDAVGLDVDRVARVIAGAGPALDDVEGRCRLVQGYVLVADVDALGHVTLELVSFHCPPRGSACRVADEISL